MNSDAAPTPHVTPRIATAFFDEEGFLVDTASWSRETACHIAERVGIGPLTPEHWAAISCVRGRYLRCRALPPVRLICRACGFSRDAIERLFAGYKNLRRVAGLPDPGEEAKAYIH